MRKGPPLILMLVLFGSAERAPLTSSQESPGPEVEFVLVTRQEPKSSGDPVEYIQEAKITMGRPFVRGLIVPSAAKSRPAEAAHYLLRLQFAFHRPRAGRQYQKIDIHVQFNDARIRVLDLYPLDASGDSPERVLSVLPNMRLRLGDRKDALERLDLRFPLRQPVQALGIGENSIDWHFSSEPEKTIRPGQQEAFILLEVPQGLHRLDGWVWTGAETGNLVGGKWWVFRRAKSDTHQTSWDLL